MVTPAMMMGASDSLAVDPVLQGGEGRGEERQSLQLRFCPVTGYSYGENKIATTHAFQKTAMNWNGLLHFPRLHFGVGNRSRVQKSRPRQIRPYAAALGTPAAETREVKATLDGRMVQETMAPTPQTTMTAFRGWPSLTRETQPENGRTPSRATAKTSRDAATMAMAVFYEPVRMCAV